MKTLTGTVVANKMHKTVVVELPLIYVHPLYKKAMKRATRVKVHSDTEIAVGSEVGIVEVKPISKDKHFKVVSVVTKTAK
jgi:small subunit ribosomal protein S17